MITFQSDASGDVMMFDPVARHMMEIMGKDVATRGAITVEQMPECIARLQAAIAADRAGARGAPGDGDETEESGVAARVSLAQRALPLVELLERSLARNKPVLWGV
jgi:hypothetical protein